MVGPYYTTLQNISPPHVSAFGGVGLLGNLVSIVVLLSKEMRKNCFNNILTALNITDSLHIVFAILEVVRVDFNLVYNSFLPHSFFPYFHYPAYRICLCASIYLIMAGDCFEMLRTFLQIVSVGVERFLAVCRPHHYREVQVRETVKQKHRAALIMTQSMCLKYQ